MRSSALLPTGLAILAVLAGPVVALAQTAVGLKASPVSHGATVTLGDLFSDAGPAAGIVVARAAPPGLDTILDAGQVQIAARRAGLVWANATGFHRIAVSSIAGDAPPAGGTKAARAKSAARRGHANQALTYTRNISTGEILSAADLVWSDEVMAAPDGFSDPEAAIGKSARHALRAGAAASVHDLALPKVIKRDDIVAVTFADGGVSLTLQAKAMGDAAVGDSLTVINPQSKKVIEAICSGPDQAVIGPAADALRAASYTQPGQSRLQTASLR
jgi:flagella basal body P-ring formation protein FlgA